MMDQATGELAERRLEHESGEAQAFYRGLAGGGLNVAHLFRGEAFDFLLRVPQSSFSRRLRV